MDKKDFLRLCTDVFRESGFHRKGGNYYLDYNEELLVVFSFLKSSYGAYFYVEYGLVFKSINRFLPHPKYNQIDINFGRIMTCCGKAIEYEVMTEIEFNELSNTIKEYVANIISIVEKGKEEIIRQCIHVSPPIVSYVLKGTPEFLGVSTDLFRGNGIAVVDY